MELFFRKGSDRFGAMHTEIARQLSTTAAVGLINGGVLALLALGMTARDVLNIITRQERLRRAAADAGLAAGGEFTAEDLRDTLDIGLALAKLDG